ncbi:hypothetical protein ACOMHN_054382 [Nucella lapillus]
MSGDEAMFKCKNNDTLIDNVFKVFIHDMIEEYMRSKARQLCGRSTQCEEPRGVAATRFTADRTLPIVSTISCGRGQCGCHLQQRGPYLLFPPSLVAGGSVAATRFTADKTLPLVSTISLVAGGSVAAICFTADRTLPLVSTISCGRGQCGCHLQPTRPYLLFPPSLLWPGAAKEIGTFSHIGFVNETLFFAY